MPAPEPSGLTEAAPARNPIDRLTIVLAALMAYVPLLFTQPGKVGADTKTYLYLDPAALLRDAPYVWDSQIGLGTVTHQNIGYLFPMGPFYWFFEAIGTPDWVAQRLWLGSVLFGAAMGMRFLVRTLDRHRALSTSGGVLVASLAYMLSPYFLSYAARISVILLPWAALPWLLALTMRAVRRGGWRDPAWFAFVVLVVGGINATALLLVGLGPLAWLVYAVAIEREATVGEALAAAGRIALLTVGTSLWWIAGLWAEGRYGLPVIRYTETYRTVSESSTAPEVLRGLGYWFFYGNDKLGPWIEPSAEYTNRVPLLALSYLLPILALTAAALVRWRHRGYVLALLVIGALAAIAGHPWGGASLLGGIFTAGTRTDVGLSLRSTPRAVPLVILATSLLLGAGVTAVGRRLPRYAAPVTALVAVLVVLNLPPLWTGSLVAQNLQRDEAIPTYWQEVAAHLDAGDHLTRVLEVPGTDFASYRWGNTVDPVTPGLMERGYVARELFQWGSPQSADLLNAFDRRLHEESLDPEAIATMARILGVGDIVTRSDLQYERFRIARPRDVWDLFRSADGLGEPTAFGPRTPNVAGPEQTMVDEVELGTPVDLEHPPAVGVFPVDDPRPIVRALQAEHPLLMSGDGDGIVDAAGSGLLDPDQALFSSASFATTPDVFATVYDQDADLLVTDTNRRRAHRWGSLREITGYTERAGEVPGTYDPTDQRLEVFPGSGDEARTVTELRLRDGEGLTTGATITASAYGNPITYTPDDRPALALDGDPLSAWRVGALDGVGGESLVIALDEPVTVESLNLLQPINLERTRWITAARLHFDDQPPVDVDLDERSRAESGEGQTIDLSGPTTFERLEIEVLADNIGWRPRYEGVSGVGFAEVRIPGVGIEEFVRPPVDLLDAAGASSADHRLSWLFTRLRSNPAEPVRGDEESTMRRILDVPTGRAFTASGQARLSAFLDDATIDSVVGMPGVEAGGVTATSGTRLPGSLRSRASSALDGDSTTAWTSTFQQRADAYLDLRVPEPVTFDQLTLEVVADGRHSVPTRIRIEAAVGDAAPVPVAAVDLPYVWDQSAPGDTVTLPIDLPNEVTGDHLLVVVESVRQVPTRDWYSNVRTITPLSIAELGIPGVSVTAPTGEVDSGCRDDLAAIDGVAVPLRVTGSVDDALDRRALAVAPCPAAPATDLDAGEHLLRTADGRVTTFDVDRLVLASAAGGEALPLDALPRDVSPGPEVTVTDDGRVQTTATVGASSGASWLVLGQSWSDGWVLEGEGLPADAPVLINGFANGWLLPPSTTPVDVTLTWTPQRAVWIAIVASAIAGLSCLVLLVTGRRRADRRLPSVAPPEAPDEPTAMWPPLADAPPVRGTAALVGFAVAAVAVAVNVPSGWSLLAIVPMLAVAVASLRWRRGQNLPATAAAACLALAGAFITIQQFRHRYPPDFAWPGEFAAVHLVGLAAVLLLGVQVVRDGIDRMRPGTTGVTGDDDGVRDNLKTEAT